ncbi:MAG TPA: bifunctional [glutamate--ammonia ligase]-adenylyl-L-tyrosine phosphorylase/[glutamate--ammonia-ligase] adenylyltransferase [Burkholderiales bacterium]|nr:bifunctional [glutamate--ammonia ligase]-adenylyl-L-tyrosine phosphorylase/[glutamate--ammonia-ligase] adenylyltransferase [Burkholderiales bacterium]
MPIALSSSRYAQHVLQARPELRAELAAPAPFAREAMRAELAAAPTADEAALKARLRRLRQRVLLRVMARDLGGLADLAEVCGTMSDLAEESIATALDWTDTQLAAEFGNPRGAAGAPQELVVVAMGKLGGRELNVSSDIDLVFLYPEEGETDGARRVSSHEYFARAGRKLISLLAEVTEDGFAFRVDMRLRPYGESGPLVASFDALENYLVAQGREWERYAWIKARALTGGCDADLAAIVRPFVYRKYLDYATLAAMRRLHGEVRREVERRELADHVKLGPGGIREIEFVAQALQLARGGRDPELTVRPTLAVLERLAARRVLPQAAARELSAAYVFLRSVEHRLQYLDDRQTHSLPGDEADRGTIAAMCGCASWSDFAARLAETRAAVTRHFQAVFAENLGDDAGGLWQDDRAAMQAALAACAFQDPAASAARLAALRASQRYAQLPEDSRRRFDALVPALARAAGATPDPDATLARGLDLVEAVARRAAYLALLAEHPEALERIARIVSASSWAAEFVTRHPLLLDELLDDRVLYAPPDWPAFSRSLGALLAAHAGDTEAQMNLLREQHQAQVFRLLAQDLAGLLTVERLADHLSALADIALGATLELAWGQVRRHREGPPRFAVIGYGKLGGKELGYASDLDIIFLYDDPDERAQEAYARLGARVNNWLTTRTSAGVLFATDLRLRPSGASGLLVSSVAAFEEYQEKQAWVWEHQALTRARFCAGDAAIGAAFEAIRERILRRSRDPQALAREVLAMRGRMHKAHPNPSALFDVKHDPGGMIDLEFVVQYLVLAHAHRHPGLTGNLGNIALLGMAGELGLIAPELARRTQEAYREFRRVQHALRLGGAQYARVPPEQLAAHARAVRELWELVLGAAGTG